MSRETARRHGCASATNAALSDWEESHALVARLSAAGSVIADRGFGACPGTTEAHAWCRSDRGLYRARCTQSPGRVVRYSERARHDRQRDADPGGSNGGGGEGPDTGRTHHAGNAVPLQGARPHRADRPDGAADPLPGQPAARVERPFGPVRRRRLQWHADHRTEPAARASLRAALAAGAGLRDVRHRLQATRPSRASRRQPSRSTTRPSSTSRMPPTRKCATPPSRSCARPTASIP